MAHRLKISVRTTANFPQFRKVWNNLVSRASNSPISTTRKHRVRLVRPCVSRLSLPFKLRRALLQERAGAFVLVLRRAADGEERGFEVEAFGEGHVEAVVYRFHGVLHRQRSVGDDLGGDGFGARD